jgi:glycosyltransferase involved in cell wall biosynthesis
MTCLQKRVLAYGRISRKATKVILCEVKSSAAARVSLADLIEPLVGGAAASRRLRANIPASFLLRRITEGSQPNTRCDFVDRLNSVRTALEYLDVPPMNDPHPVPKVTVIIPTFNSAAYIGNAISSVLASKDVPVEVIVIDDGSNDGTWELLERLDVDIRKVRQERGGPYRARNLGAQLARGEWLAFLDADDDWSPDKLARQLALATDDIGLVYTDRLNFGDLSRVSERQSDSVTLWDDDVFEPLLLGNFITLSSVMIRKTWFERLGGFAVEQRGVQDWDLWLRYSAEGGRVALVREPLTRYRIHREQMTNDLDQRAADRESVLRRALALPRGQEVAQMVARRAFANVWEIAAWHAIDRRWKAIAWYVRSASYWPWNLRVYKGIVKSCLGRV